MWTDMEEVVKSQQSDLKRLKNVHKNCAVKVTFWWSVYGKLQKSLENHRNNHKI